MMGKGVEKGIYYRNIFTKAGLSRITGVNESQLWHDAAGVHKRRRKQLEKIQEGILSLTKELSAINLRVFLYGFETSRYF